MIIKCKMCGGDLEFVPGATYGTCEYCGSTSTIPQAEDESKLNRYNRANHFRRQCEFDKAVAAYEKILEQDDTDAEAHWGAVISRYGIEYVEDPATKKRIPTCHRVQVASILADADYQAAVKNAPDAASRDLYKQQAAEIAEIQKGILAISANEKPYDVFICYKETDENGQRTHDSQWAQEVYYGLTEQGYKVFFSRITLEDKLGQQYEPYIFAALNSAKVMVVIGSKPEYFNAVWVKNEWSRYLALMAKDRKRLLIPCYRDMDPYDLPEELSSLQSQDMGKIGFMQDLLRGIKKVLDVEKKPEQPKVVQPVVQKVVQTAAPVVSASTDPLLRRAFMFLEDGDWSSANEYCEKVLDIEPENGRAYLGKLMAELNVKHENRLSSQQIPFDANINYKKALRYGDSELKKQLEKDIKTINDRIENERQAGVFRRGKEILSAATDIDGCRQAKTIFASIPHYDGVKKMIAECERKEENLREQMYSAAVAAMKGAGDSSEKWDEIKQLLASDELKNYRDVAKLHDQALKRYNECLEIENKKAEALSKKVNRYIFLGVLVAIIAAVTYYVITGVIVPGKMYKEAQYLRANGAYDEAAAIFKEIATYSDSLTQVKETMYQQAKALMAKEDYTGAVAIFNEIKTYKDVDSLLRNNPNISVAARKAEFTTVGNIITFGHYEQDNDVSNGKETIKWQVLDVKENEVLIISKYTLDAQPYNNARYGKAGWGGCSLRAWLNETFLNEAFTVTEQTSIQTTSVYVGEQYINRQVSKKYTEDKIFLLSWDEVVTYFETERTRVSTSTAYAREQARKVHDGDSSDWWLRSVRGSDDRAPCIFYSGTSAGNILSFSLGVRPAMWVNLEAGIIKTYIATGSWQ